MLSFGIEYERAFSIAFFRARFPAGSGPPSFAATMIARESLEKSFPRLASAAPFLCLIDDHLLCPDTQRLPHRIQEHLVHARVVCQLGMERGDEDAPVANEHGPALVLGENLHVARRAHARRADEDAAQRGAVTRERKIGLEARDLAAIRVPVDLDVDEAEMVAVEDDHPGTRTQNWTVECTDRLVEPVEPHQAHERRRLTARNHEPVESLELLRFPHLDRVDPQATQHRQVFAKVALDGEDTDAWAHYQPRVSSSSSGARAAADSPLIASPRPRETRARISASL